MNIKMLKAAVAGLVLSVSAFANAGLIVDTGPGPGNNWGGYTLNSDQWLAGEFSIGQQSTISSIEGWIGGGGGTLTLAIYSDNGVIPGSEVFSLGFTAGQFDNWYGVDGLGLLLNAGTYWAAFEVRGGDTLNGWMEDPVPSPLTRYAHKNSNGWNNNGSLNIGLRINEAQEVPEPSTLAIFALGIIALASRRSLLVNNKQ